MATTTTVILADDLDHTEAAGIRTVTFGLGTELFEIDLKPENRRKLATAFAPYIGHGRPASPARPGRTARPRRPGRRGGTVRASAAAGAVAGPAVTAGRADIAQVRAWAAAEGYDVPDRGLVAGCIISKYDQRHQARRVPPGPVPPVIWTPPTTGPGLSEQGKGTRLT